MTEKHIENTCFFFSCLQNASPELTASYASQLTFWWFNRWDWDTVWILTMYIFKCVEILAHWYYSICHKRPGLQGCRVFKSPYEKPHRQFRLRGENTFFHNNLCHFFEDLSWQFDIHTSCSVYTFVILAWYGRDSNILCRKRTCSSWMMWIKPEHGYQGLRHTGSKRWNASAGMIVVFSAMCHMLVLQQIQMPNNINDVSRRASFPSVFFYDIISLRPGHPVIE